jgi:hypothetical protein
VGFLGGDERVHGGPELLKMLCRRDPLDGHRGQVNRERAGQHVGEHRGRPEFGRQSLEPFVACRDVMAAVDGTQASGVLCGLLQRRDGLEKTFAQERGGHRRLHVDPANAT